jgi:hypothetical protein
MCSFEYFRNLLCYRYEFLVAIPAAYQSETDRHARLESLSTSNTIGLEDAHLTGEAGDI